MLGSGTKKLLENEKTFIQNEKIYCRKKKT